MCCLIMHIPLPALSDHSQCWPLMLEKTTCCKNLAQSARAVVSGKHHCSITEMKALLIRFSERGKRKY